MKLACLLLIYSVAVVRSSGLDGETQPATVTLKHVEPAEVIYTLHHGPYWGLGKVFSDVTAYRARQGQTGPMFSRYLDDPMNTEVAKLRTEVGFFVNGEVEIEPGYRRKKLPGHDAATLLIEGRYGMSIGHHRTVLDWMASKGYHAAGPVMEIYPARAGKRSIVEIRVPALPTPQTDASDSRETPGFAELVSAKRYQAAAEMLIPSLDALPAIDRKWLLDVVDRLRVVREIVDKKYGRRADEVLALLGPIIERGRRFPRDPEMPGAKARSDPSPAAGIIAKQRADILGELDRVMVRAHLKVLEADELYDRLVTLLTRVGSIVGPRGVQTARSTREDRRRKDSP